MQHVSNRPKDKGGQAHCKLGPPHITHTRALQTAAILGNDAHSLCRDNINSEWSGQLRHPLLNMVAMRTISDPPPPLVCLCTPNPVPQPHFRRHLTHSCVVYAFVSRCLQSATRTVTRKPPGPPWASSRCGCSAQWRCRPGRRSRCVVVCRVPAITVCRVCIMRVSVALVRVTALWCASYILACGMAFATYLLWVISCAVCCL